MQFTMKRDGTQKLTLTKSEQRALHLARTLCNCISQHAPDSYIEGQAVNAARAIDNALSALAEPPQVVDAVNK